ncbi:MAG: FAD-dependent oxidoreductase [Candidatus Thermoplasmatota archaeon]|nr:FAD-dependent oxidoreductase [Candidatus Thermoplasmatota archaeon]
MKSLDVDVAIIGGGPAGLSAAVSAKRNGAKKVLVVDRNSWLGGILPQCIHDGFGVEETGNSMTGPEYAEMYIKMAEKQKIKMLKETMVLRMSKHRKLLIVNENGLQKINAKSIVLAMGCREKTRWNVMIPGDRPSGIYTAGVAQAFINLYNIMPGRNVLILGSGDVGLIMARRLTFEGANVLGVVEILPHASGLLRNVVQCLDDYDIPLYLNHTVTHIKGKERLENVTIAQVDEKFNVISGTEQKIMCDTLLLSLGLIPENELSKNVGIILDNVTLGPVVDQNFETNITGFFACGNCLQVYDTVDVLSKGAQIAGRSASERANGEKLEVKKTVDVVAGKGIRYVIPQKINKKGFVHFTLRVHRPQTAVTIVLQSADKEIYKKKLPYVNPSSMIAFDVEITDELIRSTNSIEVSINDSE